MTNHARGRQSRRGIDWNNANCARCGDICNTVLIGLVVLKTKVLLFQMLVWTLKNFAVLRYSSNQYSIRLLMLLDA